MSSEKGIKLSETEDVLEETEIPCETGDSHDLLENFRGANPNTELVL